MVVCPQPPAGDAPGPRRAYAAVTEDVSAGGLRARGVPFMAPGTPVKVMIAWDTPPAAFQLAGHVAHYQPEADGRPGSAGVSFDDDGSDAYRRWQEFASTVLMQEFARQFAADGGRAQG